MIKNNQEYYLQKAEENLPQLISNNVIPFSEATTLNKGDNFIIDLGNHYVGYFSFSMNYLNSYIDAPIRLLVKFCETKDEIEYDFSAYNGTLCASWLQEEFINIDYPGVYKMPRRYAARYVKITVLHTPRAFSLSDFCFTAVTSANPQNLEKIDTNDCLLKKIDSIAVNTLKNCMQRIFEDGPKRDRRLWIGDLRLEALTNYCTFNNLDLVKRCLYLFAAAQTNEKGFLPGYVYENPKFVSGYWFLEDYALLFVVSLCDYYNHTKDLKTFLDLYPIAKAQMDAANATLDKNGIITIAKGCDAFIDWCEGLEKVTALHGVYLYTLNALTEILSKTGHCDCYLFEERKKNALLSAKKFLYNKSNNNFVTTYSKSQNSVHSVVWMILGGVISGENAWEILQNVLNDSASLKPVTPYMHHYVVEALIKLDKYEEAFSYIKNYWGKMAELGADTFYEVFVPEAPETSPYKDKMINSMCHAWSCSPSYFIREFKNKQKQD